MVANQVCWCKVLRYVIVLLCCASFISCYNVDTVNFVKHTRRDEEMFGFTVAAHRERGYSWILVGAPKGQSHRQYLQGVRRGGAVFRCDTLANDTCGEVEFDPKGDNLQNGIPIDKKSEQWFGATLHSAGTDGPVVACAPRYIWFTTRVNQRRDPVGTCFVARNNFQNVSEYSPCRTSQWGYNRQGSCQAGFSAAISKDGRRLFIGAPGSWYWQGQMYSINANAKFPFTSGLFSTFGAGQVIQTNLESRPAVVQTPEGSAVDDDSYLGYSIAVGDFSNEGYQGIAAGMPKGDQLRGKVLLYTWNLTNFKNITGTQMGSYFGYSTAAGDIDGDGLDDLVIGAPLFTLPNNEAKYEVGRVYVIYQQSAEGSFRRVHELDGFNSKSRFGLSVASLGDINLDGYGDFAVGAPYDGPDERGAVYIFHGSKNGVRKKFSQKITSEEMTGHYGPPIKTFGFSIAGGIDLDGNDYPDTVIGAYLSNTVYYLKSRPVAKIDARVEFLIMNKEIVLEQKNCTLDDGTPVACTTFEVCFNYKGVGVPRDITLNVEYILDAKKPTNPRIFFFDMPNTSSFNDTYHLIKDQTQNNCKTQTVYIKNEIRDKLNPLEVEVRYSMEQREHYDRGQLVPILDYTEPPVRKDSITVHKNCGSDNICIPDLSLIVKPNFERYLLGSKEKLELDVIVENTGEDSFETTYSIQLPEGVDFNKVVEVDQKEMRVSCTAGENNTINCDVGNPLPSRTIAHFKMELKPYHKEGMKPSYDFLMLANSTNPEEKSTLSNNRLALSIPIYVNSTLFIQGKAKPAEVRNITTYTAKTIKHETDIGPQVIHVYYIKNEGPSTINETEMVFLWPAATESGDDLMYLIEEPQVQGNVVCELAQANYKDYIQDLHKKTIWEALETEKTKTEVSMEGTKIGVDGVKVEEGPVVPGKLPEDKKTDFDYEKSSGDASFVHQQRQQKVYEESQQGGGSSGTTVHVTEDKGRGGTVHTITTVSNKTTPVVTTTTFVKNTTTFYGPDGRVIKQESSSGGLPVHTMTTSSNKTEPVVASTTLYKNTTTFYGPDGRVIKQESSSGELSGGSHIQGGQHRTTHYSGGQYGAIGERNDNRHESSRDKQFSGQHDEYNRSYSSSGKTQHTSHHTGSYVPSHDSSREQQFGTSGERRYESHSHGITDDRTGDRRYQASGYSSNQNQYEQGSSHGGFNQHGQSTHQQSGGHSHSSPSKHTTQIEGTEITPIIYGNAYSSEEYSGDPNLGLDDLYRDRNKNYSHTINWNVQGNFNQSSLHGGQHGGQSHYSTGQDHAYSGSDHSNSQVGRHPSTYGEQNRDWEEDYAKHGIGAAALDHGFKTGGLDLGTLGSTKNVDETISKPAGQHYDPDLGWISTAQSGSTQHSDSGHGYQSGSGQWSQKSHWSTSGSSHNSLERDNVETERPNYRARHLGRRKRQAINLNAADIKDIIKCKTNECKLVKCIAGPMKKDEDITVGFRWRINVHTLQNISSSQSIKFVTMALARISKVPYIGSPVNKTVFKHEIVTTVLPPEPDAKPKVVPLWMVVLSAVAGVIILLLLAFLLYKCGFFKRNRVSDAPERQPLNKNGHYYNGDEAL